MYMKKSFLMLALLLPVLASGQPGGMRQGNAMPGQMPDSPKLEEYFEPAAAGAAEPDAEGFIRRWLILEPIPKPNRSNTVFTDSYLRDAFGTSYFKGQLGALPKDGQKTKVTITVTPAAPMMWGMPSAQPQAQPPAPQQETRTLQWHALDSKLFNVKLFRFASGLQKDVYGVLFWLATAVECDEDIPNVRLAAGSNAGSMWWLNGEEVLIMSSDRRMVMDDCMSRRLTLKKGRNIIWGAVINGPGMSDCCIRFVDEAGNPVRNIKIYSK